MAGTQVGIVPPIACVCALATLASVGRAQSTMTVESSRVSPEDPAVLLSELDNPRVVGTFQLGDSAEGLRADPKTS